MSRTGAASPRIEQHPGGAHTAQQRTQPVTAISPNPLKHLPLQPFTPALYSDQATEPHPALDSFSKLFDTLNPHHILHIDAPQWVRFAIFLPPFDPGTPCPTTGHPVSLAILSYP